MILSSKYMEYLNAKTHHEVSQLKSIDKDVYKIIIVTFLRNMFIDEKASPGVKFVLLRMLKNIHNLDSISLEILYHLLHNDKTKNYVTKIYSEDGEIEFLSGIIMPYVSVGTLSPNIGDFYIIPILASIKDVSKFKDYISRLLDALLLSPQEYNVNKISILRSALV
jgi:hypothetical protein